MITTERRLQNARQRSICRRMLATTMPTTPASAPHRVHSRARCAASGVWVGQPGPAPQGSAPLPDNTQVSGSKNGSPWGAQFTYDASPNTSAPTAKADRLNTPITRPATCRARPYRPAAATIEPRNTAGTTGCRGSVNHSNQSGPSRPRARSAASRPSRVASTANGSQAQRGTARRLRVGEANSRRRRQPAITPVIRG